MTMMLTRFTKTAGGYRRLDVLDFDPGAETADQLTAVAQMAARDPGTQLQAWSFCHFNAGRMSSETWRGAHGIILEFMLGSRDEPDQAERFRQILAGADRTGLGYLVATTQTRYGEPTITLAFPTTERTTSSRYARIASVLAAQVDQYEAAPGIIAPTHLVHAHQDTIWSWVEGPAINPDAFIRMTKDDAQTIDPMQFERRRPPVVPIAPPKGIVVDDGLFSW